MKISLVEYGAGNLPSVERALARQGIETERASTPEAVAAASALILPGVGHFGQLMRTLGARGLLAPLREAISSGVPLLGICLGLQALFASSDEAPGDAGLEHFPGTVSALPATAKLPHMGWNQLRRVRPSVLLEGVPADAYFYFAHSYAALDAGECGCGTVRSRRAVRGRARARERFRRAVSSRKNRATWARGCLRISCALRRREEQRMTLARRIIPCLDTDGERVVKGVQFCQSARCRRSRGAGGALQHRRRRRTGRAGYRRLARSSADVSRNDSPRGRGTGDSAHGRRRRRHRRRGPRHPARRRGQAHREYGGAAAIRSCSPNSRLNSARRPWCWRLTPSAWVNTGRRSCAAGSESTGRDAVAWAHEGAECGAGEILMTSMDRDGTRSGFDLALTAAVSDRVTVPVIASGGADTPKRFPGSVRRRPGRCGAGGFDFSRRRSKGSASSSAICACQAASPVRLSWLTHDDSLHRSAGWPRRAAGPRAQAAHRGGRRLRPAGALPRSIRCFT